MTRYAHAERDNLSDTFLRVGPDAPTLCEGWDGADLATHLVVRDGRPDLLIGSMLPVVGPVARGRMRLIKEMPWEKLVRQVRSGPPIYNPAAFGPVDELVNLLEFYIHHEDVLRAQPGPLSRRSIPKGEEEALWKALQRMARPMFRRSAVGVELISPYGRIQAKGSTERGNVALEGDPGELVLASYGRHQVAHLSAEGTPEAVAALWSSKLGLA